MNILEKIVAHKRIEVETQKELYPAKLLEQSIYFETPTISLSHYLKREDLTGIIAELKRKSPSQGDIHPYLDVEKVSIGYMQAGAAALSVLTDKEFFGGSIKDLKLARKMNYCPILRKEFIIDEYQIIEAKSIGADAILLIAACLSAAEVKTLAAFAQSLGMEVLLEVHNLEELQKVEGISLDLVGVNNRNLSTFEVDINTSLQLVDKIPENVTKIAESGLSDPAEVVRLKQAGFDGFLMGQRFMETARPEKACARFIEKLTEQLATQAIN